MEDEEDDIQQVRKNSDENKPANYNKDYEQELSALKSQLEILKEKEKMAKSQSQATMVYYIIYNIYKTNVFMRNSLYE